MITPFKRLLNPKRRQILKRIKNTPLVFGKPKVFCISLQRSGTTSVGKFLNDHGIITAGYTESKFYNWDYYWMTGQYEKIFKCKGFRSFQGFQDNPWWAQGFFKVLFFRFPSSKFILLTRSKEEWYESMKNHSSGNNPGNTYSHCLKYNRLEEFYTSDLTKKNLSEFSLKNYKVDNLLELNTFKNNYLAYHTVYHKEVETFFSSFDKSQERLFVAELSDPNKWIKLGEFLGFEVSEKYDSHSNKSVK